MEFNLADLFESVVDVAADQTAVVADGRRLSYAELEVRANQLAHRLAAAGIGSGNFVGVQLANGSAYLEAMLACFKLRAVPVNVNYRYVTEELRYLYDDAGLVGLVFHSRYGGAVAGALDALRGPRLVLEVGDESGPAGLGEDYEEALADRSALRDFGARSADDRYCIYTGGTTGMPKGVLWRHEDIFFAAMGGGDPLSLGNVIGAPEELGGRVMHPGLAALASPPFMHASGQWLAFTLLFGGGKVVTLPAGRFDPEALWRLAGTEAVNILVVVGDAMAVPVLDWLEAHPGVVDTSSLLAVGSGGAALSASTKRRLATALPTVMVIDAFGSSETGQLGGSAPADDPYGAPRLHVDDRTDVLDDDLRPVLAGSEKVGRLARSGHIPVGYLGDPEKTASTFVEVDGKRWALPGDLATVGEDGSITLLGRGALSINTGGEKVYPEEVERALREHPDVADVVVVGAPHERFGEQVVAVVQPRVGSAVDAEALRDTCRERLAAYKVPRIVVITDAVVRSPAGKADYRWARSVADEAAKTSGIEPVSTPSIRVAELSGPVTAGRIVEPVSPVPVDLAAHGYVEEEFFASGVASSFAPTRTLTPDGHWDVEPLEEAPYATRIVVRRPAEAGRFSGTALVEWCNVSGGLEAAADWAYLHDEILRSGHAYVAVSAQALGVDGGTALLEVPGVGPPGGLVGACPERYGSLAHPGDRFAFDLFSQVGRALRLGGAPAPFGDLSLKHLLAVGESQSAFFLVTYVNAPHHGTEVFDGFLVHSRGGSSASYSGSVLEDGAIPEGVRVRDDVRVPVFTLQTETDLTPLLGFAPARQPDTDRIHTWEVAGTAHADAYLVGPVARLLGCEAPVNSGPHHEVAQAALHALVRWVEEGTPPPSAPPLELAASSPAVLARDEHGNARGGVRTPAVEVPVATQSGEAPEGANAVCSLFGSTVPFDGATLRRLYGDEVGYVAAYQAALDEAVEAGFVLPADRTALLERALAVVFPQ